MDGRAPGGVFSVSVDQIDGTALLQLYGQFDTSGISEAQAAFARASPLGPVVVDLRGLTFIDSMGLAILVSAAKARLDDDRSALQFIRGPDHVQRVFESTQVDRVLAWVEVA